MSKVPVIEQTEPVETKPKSHGVRWYWWVVIIIVSMMFGAAFKTDKEVTKYVTKEVPGQTITKEIPADLTNWKALKSKDDEIINLAGDGFSVVSEIFNAAANFDTVTMENKTIELQSLTDKMQKLTPERLEILNKLGY